ncbi:hypothetical protein P4S54_12050 [Shewanella sp. PP-He15 brown]
MAIARFHVSLTQRAVQRLVQLLPSILRYLLSVGVKSHYIALHY